RVAQDTSGALVTTANLRRIVEPASIEKPILLRTGAFYIRSACVKVAPLGGLSRACSGCSTFDRADASIVQRVRYEDRQCPAANASPFFSMERGIPSRAIRISGASAHCVRKKTTPAAGNSPTTIPAWALASARR